MICDVSRKEFQTIYDRLDIKLKEVGESFYNDQIPPLVKKLQDEGFVVEDKGAQCFYIPGIENPLLLVKKDGGFNYDSTDMAAINYRFNVLGADRCIYITDKGQEFHFK